MSNWHPRPLEARRAKTAGDRHQQGPGGCRSMGRRWPRGGCLARNRWKAVWGRTPGFLRAGTGQVVMQRIADQVNPNDLPEPLKKTLTTIVGTKVSVIVAGATGGVTAGNATENNYLKHDQLISLKPDIEACNARKCPDEERSKMLNYYSGELNKIAPAWQLAPVLTAPTSKILGLLKLLSSKRRFLTARTMANDVQPSTCISKPRVCPTRNQVAPTH